MKKILLLIFLRVQTVLKKEDLSRKKVLSLLNNVCIAVASTTVVAGRYLNVQKTRFSKRVSSSI